MKYFIGFDLGVLIDVKQQIDISHRALFYNHISKLVSELAFSSWSKYFFPQMEFLHIWWLLLEVLLCSHWLHKFLTLSCSHLFLSILFWKKKISTTILLFLTLFFQMLSTTNQSENCPVALLHSCTLLPCLLINYLSVQWHCFWEGCFIPFKTFCKGILEKTGRLHEMDDLCSCICWTPWENSSRSESHDVSFMAISIAPLKGVKPAATCLSCLNLGLHFFSLT